ncbi:MAG TPA: hypothetical protein DCL44_02650 [Elusimicrobia bacterium]|nr:hypothetical protein [Elusimicrobiota bacterium]
MYEKRMLLISANTEGSPYPVYPLALPRLAAALKSRGYLVSQYDMLSGSIPELELKIQLGNPDLIGLSLRNIDNIDSCAQKSYISGYSDLVSRIRACSKAPVVLGGSGFSIFPEQLMSCLGADYGIAGRGEEILCYLADCVSEGREPCDLKHLYSKNKPDDKARRPVTWPVSGVNPAEHKKEMLQYYWRRSGMIGVQTKTGCPLNCVYCTYPLIEGGETCFFKTASVVNEIERLWKDFGVEYVFFVDSVFNMKRERELELAEALIKRKVKVSWGAFFSPLGIDGQYLKTLKRSGLTHIELGSDSFSDKVLADYRKNFRYSDILKTSQEAFKAGIPTAHYLIFGGPGESVETIKDTFDKSRKHRLTTFFAALGMRVYPGTEMARIARSEGLAQRAECGLDPVFYYARGLDAGFLEQVVKNEVGTAANWVLPGNDIKNNKAMQRLRGLGKSGPLWEYLCR